LAQAHLKLEPATESAVAKAIEYLNLAQKNAATSGRTSVATSPATLLTSKLILTAPKKLLDEVGKDLSLEQFRASVRVERLTIPYPEAARGSVSGPSRP
jgi:hypothetical protein